MLPGNVNTYSAHKVALVPAVVASRVRFLPHSVHPRTVCMRVEVWGCRYRGTVRSYTAPPGSQFSARAGMRDQWDGGLGLLTDGLPGAPLSLATQPGLESGRGWVGWTDSGRPLQIEFVFRGPQVVREVELVSYTQPDLGILVSTAPMLAHLTLVYLTTSTQAPDKLFVTLTGSTGSYSERVELIADGGNSSQPGITVTSFTFPNSSRPATRANLGLAFRSKWILLSEVQFSSSSLQPRQGKEMLGQSEQQTSEHGE